MLDSMFTSVIGETDSTVQLMTSGEFFLCSITSLVLGCIVALVYMFRHQHSKNFVITLAVLPLIVQMVIALVNGNIGAGIAVMGVFNLVRFRSIPGSAKDIGSVFFAMAIGLATGMGFLVLAIVFTIIVSIANIIYVMTPFGRHKTETRTKFLRITAPEDIDYMTAFDDIFEKFTETRELLEVRTKNMGSLFQLDYKIELRNPMEEKQMIDSLRCRNGNLGITCGMMTTQKEVL